MPEVIGETTITPEQRTWGDAILRLTGGSTTGSPEQPKTKVEMPEGKIKNTFGKGLKESILKDGRPIPEAYTNAFAKGAKMISSDDWQKAMESRKLPPEELKKIVGEKGAIMQHLRDSAEKEKKLARLIACFNDLEEAMKKGLPCDLTWNGMGKISTGLSVKKAEIHELITTLKQEVEAHQKQATRSLTVLDTPENNPEHLKVGAGLKELGKLEDKYPEPRSEEAEAKYIKEKGALLYDLQAVVFSWNNRRTSAHLSPSADAMAMADILQRVHLEMTETVIKKGLPMPLSPENEAQLSEEEKARIQEAWKKLVESGSKEKENASGLVIKAPPIDGQYVTNDTEAQEFRTETLADLARLMQSSAGRSLITDLNNADHPIDFAPTKFDGHACSYISGNQDQRGIGCPSTVKMVRGGKDSDCVLSTATGAPLFSANFIIMGHELTHALHNAQGRNRKGIKLDKDKLWNNSEEYQTIFKGKHSEQTLRNQYGLSVERFGHITPPVREAVFQAVEKGLDTALEMSKRDPEAIDKALREREFDPQNIPDKLKLEIFDSSLKGPVPVGWEPSQLSFQQLEEILKDPALAAGLAAFGWTPFGLDRKRIEEIYAKKEHHPRSPKGIRMRTLGGEAGLQLFTDFEKATGLTLAPPKGPTWEDKLEALEGAHRTLVDLATNHSASNVRTAAAGQAKLQKRLPKVTILFKGLENQLKKHGGEAALDHVDAYNQYVAKEEKITVLRTDLASKVATLDEAAALMTRYSWGLPKRIQSQLNAGDTGQRLKTAADLCKKAAEDIEKNGGRGVLALAIKYDTLLGRQLGVQESDNPLVIVDSLTQVGADLKKLRSNSRYEPLRKAIGGSNARQDLESVIQVWQEIQIALEAFGGSAARDKIGEVSKLTNVPLERKATEIPDMVAECQAASDALEKYGREHPNPQIQKIVKSKSSIPDKLRMIEAVRLRDENDLKIAAGEVQRKKNIELLGAKLLEPFQGSKFEKDARDARGEGSLLQPVTDAHKKVGEVIASLPANIESLFPALDKLEQEADKFLKNPENQNSWFPPGKKRWALAEAALKTVQETRRLYEEVQKNGRNAIEQARYLLQNAGDVSLKSVEGLAAIATNQYLSTEVLHELLAEIGKLMIAVDQATIKREASWG